MQRLLDSKFTMLLGLIFLVFLSLNIGHALPILTSNISKISNATAQLEDIKKLQSENDQKGAYLKSDDYLEQQARLKLNYKKPGENVVFVYKNQYAVPKDSKTNSSSNDGQADQAPALPNWYKWWQYLIHK